MSDNLSPDVASLGRVSLPTWRIVIGLIVWLVGLSFITASNTRALETKADREIVEVVRKAQIDQLTYQIGEMREQLRELRQAVGEIRKREASEGRPRHVEKERVPLEASNGR